MKTLSHNKYKPCSELGWWVENGQLEEGVSVGRDDDCGQEFCCRARSESENNERKQLSLTSTQPRDNYWQRCIPMTNFIAHCNSIRDGWRMKVN